MVNYHDPVEEGEDKEDEKRHQVYDVDVEFEEAKAVKELFSRIKNVACVYTVEITPTTTRSSIKSVKVGQSYADVVAGRNGGNVGGIEMQPCVLALGRISFVEDMHLLLPEVGPGENHNLQKSPHPDLNCWLHFSLGHLLPPRKI